MLHIQWRVRRNQQPSLWAQASVRPEPPRTTRQQQPMEEDLSGPSPDNQSNTMVTLTPISGRPHTYTIRITHDLGFQPKIVIFLRTQDTIILVVRCTKVQPTQEHLPGTQGSLIRVMRLLQVSSGVTLGLQQQVPSSEPTPPRRRIRSLPPPPPRHLPVFQWPQHQPQQHQRRPRHYYPLGGPWWPR